MTADHPSGPELYDLEHGETDRDDVPFYVDRAEAADGPVLELACGTGRVHLPLLRAGVGADGLDRDPATLARLREKATREGLAASVWTADMTALAVDRAYDLVVCPFNALQHARTLPAQRATLAGVYDALAPGGRFVFDVFVPSFDVVCEHYGEWDRRTVVHEGREYRLRSRTTLADEPEQRFVVDSEVVAPDGETVQERRAELAMLPKPHVELLADGSRFATHSVAGGFDGGPLRDGDHVQVWTLTRQG